jgi:septum formation protein
LTRAGFEFTVEPADVDESLLPGEPAAEYVIRVARAKAHAVTANPRTSGSIVLAADTTVVVEGEILAKPADREDAARMLRLLGGVVHDVLTGVVAVGGGHELSQLVRTRVHLLPLSPEDIHWYVESGEPEGKAGAYAIQERAARFVDWIEGSWSNVVGLPVATVDQMLKRLGA